MKKKQWNEGLNNIDPALVEKYLAQKEALSKKQKPKNIWLRIGAIAACIVLVLCTVVGAFQIYNRNNGGPSNDPIIGDATDKVTDKDGSGDGSQINGGMYDQEEDGPGVDISPNSPVGDETQTHIGPDEILDGSATNVEEDTLLSTETGSATDIATEEIAIITEISGEKYSNYEFIGVTCAPEKVGEAIEDVMVTVKSGYLYNLVEHRATVYKVVGVDSEFCLCVKFAAENEYFDDGYHFVRAKSYMFESLDDMRDKLVYDGTLFVQAYANYTINNKTTEEYCKNFKFDDTLSEKIKQYLLELDGLSKQTQEQWAFDEKHDEANEFVTIYCTFVNSIESVTGLMRVYDTGYLYYSPFGGQLFYIGENFAREIIDIVIKQGTPEGYVWNESESTWEPIISNEMDPDTFRYALVENKLWGQINLLEEISYKANIYSNGCPDKLKLDRKYLIEVANILEDADGNEIADGVNLSDVSMTFFHSWDGGETCEITVYDSGYVELLGRYYLIGTNYTAKIIYAVHVNSTNDVGLYWDNNASVWKDKDDIILETSETQPASEDETESDTAIEYESDTAIEYETETDEWREGDPIRVWKHKNSVGTLQISKEQSDAVKAIWDSCEWVDSVIHTAYDYEIIDGDNGRILHYSYDEGILNDVTNIKSTVLTSELRTEMNNILDSLEVASTVD